MSASLVQLRAPPRLLLGCATSSSLARSSGRHRVGPALLSSHRTLAASSFCLQGRHLRPLGVWLPPVVLASGASASSARKASAPRVVGLSNVITASLILMMSLLQVVRRDVAPLCTLGVIVANVGTKALKLAVQQVMPPGVWRRPAQSARDSDKDPGFPSSHTSIMTFVSVYFALYLLLHLGASWALSMLVAVLPSALMAAARIWDRDHTILQTLGGVAWGCSLGAWWALVGPRLRGILEWMEPQPWAMVALCFAVGLPMFTKPLGLRLPGPSLFQKSDRVAPNM